MISTLKNQSEFDAVNKCGFVVKTRFFKYIISDAKHIESIRKKGHISCSIDINQLNRLDTCYIGFKISRKIGNAVTRNKIRRRIKNIIRALSVQMLQNKAMIFIPFNIISTISYQEVYLTIKKSLSIEIAKLFKLDIM